VHKWQLVYSNLTKPWYRGLHDARTRMTHARKLLRCSSSATETHFNAACGTPPQRCRNLLSRVALVSTRPHAFQRRLLPGCNDVL
jgi:hypothetical protein